MIPRFSTAKLIGAGVAALMLIGLLLGLEHYKSLAESRGETLAFICQSARDASANPKLSCKSVPAQIKGLGESLKATKDALARQNAAVAALGAETKLQQKIAAEASRKAAERARGAEAASTRLTSSSRSGERLAKPCEPSKELTGAWR